MARSTRHYLSPAFKMHLREWLTLNRERVSDTVASLDETAEAASIALGMHITGSHIRQEAKRTWGGWMAYAHRTQNTRKGPRSRRNPLLPKHVSTTRTRRRTATAPTKRVSKPKENRSLFQRISDIEAVLHSDGEGATCQKTVEDILDLQVRYRSLETSLGELEERVVKLIDELGWEG